MKRFYIKILLLNIAFIIISFYAKRNVDVIETYNKDVSQIAPKILIVPHQNSDLALRSKTFDIVKNLRPTTNQIYLIGPDHFSFTGRSVKYLVSDWNSADGIIKRGEKFDYDFGDLSIIHDESVREDHAVYNLLSDIKNSFPNATLIPILIGMNLEPYSLDPLEEYLHKNCNQDCLIIASVDFSHNLTYMEADIHDAYSVEQLKSRAFENAKVLDVDSRQSLYIAMKLATRTNLQFTLVGQSNSAKIENTPTALSTGHVYGYYVNEITD